ncbi:MAG: PIN domain-containing protein [Kiritimatiellia bacterium]
MLFDTDVIIWALRGNAKAAQQIDRQADLQVSAVSYMELLKGARDKADQKNIKSFLHDLSFTFLPVTQDISHRAVMYMEAFALSSGMELADALIAATAAEHAQELCTANNRHYRVISELTLSIFRP